MKNDLLRIIASILLLISSVLLHAQDEDPGTDIEDEYGGIDPGALEDAAPIDTSLIYLAFAGSAFAFFYYKNNKPAQRQD